MNPYKILNIDYHADKREIIEAVALAMREKKFSVQEVAIAQKEIMNPIVRAAHDFLQFIDVKPIQNQFALIKQQKKKIVFDLNRLSVFDEHS